LNLLLRFRYVLNVTYQVAHADYLSFFVDLFCLANLEYELKRKEGKELVEELVEKSERAGKDLETKVEELVQKVLEKMNVVSKEDTVKMEERIRRIEQKDASANNTGEAK